MSLLLVGTTGMLGNVARHIAASTSGDIAIVSRHPERFSFGDDATDKRATPYPIDWADQPAFLSALDTIAAAQGPFSNALVWMHGRDEPVRDRIVHHMAEGGTVVDVLGSAASRPGAFGGVRVQHMRKHSRIRYRQVLLGFVHDNGLSRWLTHEEICASTLDAFASGETVTIAGQVEPWELKP